jgi:hypothetical protein
MAGRTSDWNEELGHFLKPFLRAGPANLHRTISEFLPDGTHAVACEAEENHEQTTAPEHTGLQGKGGACRDQGRSGGDRISDV